LRSLVEDLFDLGVDVAGLEALTRANTDPGIVLKELKKLGMLGVAEKNEAMKGFGWSLFGS